MAAISSLQALGSAAHESKQVDSGQTESEEQSSARPSLLDGLRTHKAGSTPARARGPKLGTGKKKQAIQHALAQLGMLDSISGSASAVSPGESYSSDNDEPDLTAEASRDTSEISGERIAPSVLKQMSIYGSASAWVRSIDWVHNRNKNECHNLATTLDLALSEGLTDTSLTVEVMVRRLTGVHMADSTGNWDVASVLLGTIGPNG